MVELAKTNPKVCAITAAMPGGTGLLDLMRRYPERLFDVGIAEEHAVSMAGGLAKQGMVPVIALYSTFLQRAYDMILQDVGMLGLHTVFAIDRAGLVGEDGETHHGIYDVGFLRHVPGLRILCPATYDELRNMLCWAVQKQNGPVAIRYPRGSQRVQIPSNWNEPSDGFLQSYGDGADVAIVTYGNMTDNALKAALILHGKNMKVKVVRLLQVSPIPIDELCKAVSGSRQILILEELAANCGIRQAVACGLADVFPEKRIFGLDLGENYVTHGNVEALYARYGLDADHIAQYIQEVLAREN